MYCYRLKLLPFLHHLPGNQPEVSRESRKALPAVDHEALSVKVGVRELVIWSGDPEVRRVTA